MKKFLLILFILFDVLVITASVMFLISRVKMNRDNAMTIGVPVSRTLSAPPVASSSTVTISTAAQTQISSSPTASATPVSGQRKFFSYRNSRAKKVMIRGDFTDWRPAPMQKDPASGKWTYMAVLEPGEYAYCFSVDDKSIRDPSNKRTKQFGKARVSSIVVQAQTTAAR